MPEALSKGLRNVLLDETEASFIDGEKGVLLYRGYSIHDLAANSSFEEVSYLMFNGRLPNASELQEFDDRLKRQRAIPDAVLETIRITAHSHPMDVLRTAVSALAAFDPDVADDSPEPLLRKSERLTAQAPTIVAAHHRIRSGKEPVAPRTDLNHAANFLYMLNGEEPTEEAIEAMNLDFILHAEHGANASSFAARVTASTLADLHAAVTSAVGTLKGPLHGGAAEAVMKMALEIGEPERAGEYVRERQRHRESRIMGFGHRVYKVEDPRARHMRARSKALSERMGQAKWYEILEAVVQEMSRYQRHGIYVNVDFYAGSVYYLLGIPEDLFVPIFAIGRVPGWCASVIEQLNDNLLIRPLLRYEGPMDLKYVPIEQR
ncbi:MAG TPA: citrate/2-methylcitrate synthase [Dehalococcoidia bacterium]|nr:citrate/2-methylcitrate synthase [Dehalococcoidia bacterium]